MDDNISTQGILAINSALVSTGVSELNPWAVAGFSAIFFFAVNQIVGVYVNLTYDIFTSIGAMMCIYIDYSISDSASFASLPIGITGCNGPTTPLHNILPAVTMGYSMFELHNARSDSRDIVLHAAVLLAVMGIVCELGYQYMVTSMLIMQTSTIFLFFIRRDYANETLNIIMQVLFLLSFFVTRFLVAPYFWSLFLLFHLKSLREEDQCFPNLFLIVVLLFGLIFHGLNAFWLGKIVKKVTRKLKNLEMLGDTHME